MILKLLVNYIRIGLRQIYAGIYSLEKFIMALFFPVRDNNGRKTYISLGFCILEKDQVRGSRLQHIFGWLCLE